MQANKAAEIALLPADLACATSLPAILQRVTAVSLGSLPCTCTCYSCMCPLCRQEVRRSPLANLYVVHNAGSLGRVGAVAAASSTDLERDVCLNITSFVRLTEASLQASAGTPGSTTILNISSIAAIKPFPTLAQYSLWKAAREMYLATLAQECSAGCGGRSVRTLSYAPGPMLSAMTAPLPSHPDLDAGLRRMYTDLVDKVGVGEGGGWRGVEMLISRVCVCTRSQKTYVAMPDTAHKCVQMVLGGAFPSGLRTDYFN